MAAPDPRHHVLLAVALARTPQQALEDVPRVQWVSTKGQRVREDASDVPPVSPRELQAKLVALHAERVTTAPGALALALR